MKRRDEIGYEEENRKVNKENVLRKVKNVDM